MNSAVTGAPNCPPRWNYPPAGRARRPRPTRAPTRRSNSTRNRNASPLPTGRGPDRIRTDPAALSPAAWMYSFVRAGSTSNSVPSRGCQRACIPARARSVSGAGQGISDRPSGTAAETSVYGIAAVPGNQTALALAADRVGCTRISSSPRIWNHVSHGNRHWCPALPGRLARRRAQRGPQRVETRLDPATPQAAP